MLLFLHGFFSFLFFGPEINGSKINLSTKSIQNQVRHEGQKMSNCVAALIRLSSAFAFKATNVSLLQDVLFPMAICTFFPVEEFPKQECVLQH